MRQVRKDKMKYRLPSDKAPRIPWTNRERFFFAGFVGMTLLWAFCLYEWNAALPARSDFGGRSVTITLSPTNTSPHLYGRGAD
jgi:hypothetical protein